MKKIDESIDAQCPPIRDARPNLNDGVEASTDRDVSRDPQGTPEESPRAPQLPEIRVVDSKNEVGSDEAKNANSDPLDFPNTTLAPTQTPRPPRIVNPNQQAYANSSKKQAKRPWVDVHPRLPRTLAVVAIILLVCVASVAFLAKHIDPTAKDQRILTLMDAQTPELNRHADPLPEITDDLNKQGEDAAEDPESMGLDQATFSAGDARDPLPVEGYEDATRCLIIKVEDAYIRANGKLVNLVELDNICRSLTDDCHTLKLINRHGDATVVEQAVSLLNQLELTYQFVRN